jgi:hypothetical protein
MEKIVLKVIELGNYLLSVNEDKEKEINIKGVLLNNNVINNLYFVKLLRLENDLDNDNSNPDNIKRSQINDFIFNFGLLDNEEVKNKLKEYLDYFISVKNDIKL